MFLKPADTDLNDVCRRLAGLLEQVVKFDALALFLLDAESDLRGYGAYGLNKDHFVGSYVGPNHVMRRALLHKQGLHSADFDVDIAYTHSLERGAALRSALFVPVLSEEAGIGVLGLFGKRSNQFRDRHLDVVMAFSKHLGWILTLEGLAYLDHATGLPNKRQYEKRLREEIERALRSGRPLSLFIMDLKRFKSINDKFGHPVGDQVLLWTGENLARGLREQDFVARLGGDEFALICPNAGSETCHGIQSRIRATFAASPYIDPESGALEVLPNIGYATFNPDPVGGLDRDQVRRTVDEEMTALYRNADRMMYKEKESLDRRLP